MTKKVAFTAKPTANPASAEEWVKNRETATEEPMKRLTLDVPASLHRTIKTACAARGSKMADELRALLEAHYANQ